MNGREVPRETVLIVSFGSPSQILFWSGSVSALVEA
jgi:hypothetical protein